MLLALLTINIGIPGILANFFRNSLMKRHILATVSLCLIGCGSAIATIWTPTAARGTVHVAASSAQALVYKADEAQLRDILFAQHKGLMQVIELPMPQWSVAHIQH